jgi:hypothetical protein
MRARGLSGTPARYSASPLFAEFAMLKPLLATLLLVAGTAPAFAQMDFDNQYQRMCGNVLNILPRIVRPQAVLAVPNDASVSIHEICTGVQLNDFGNAAGLGHYIASNRALSHALARHGYRPDDVVGVQINGDSVQLYVHRA